MVRDKEGKHHVKVKLDDIEVDDRERESKRVMEREKGKEKVKMRDGGDKPEMMTKVRSFTNPTADG